METIAKNWYDSLAKGQIMGTKCKDCGSYTFPPLTVCRECRSRNLVKVKMSGKGELIMYSSTILPAKIFADIAPIPYGMVKLKEGPVFYTKIEGVSVKSTDEIQKGNEKLPVKVSAKIRKVVGMNIVTFKV